MDFFRLPREDFVRENCFPGDTMKVLTDGSIFSQKMPVPILKYRQGLAKHSADVFQWLLTLRGNGWNNTDGADDNRSWNCGYEGPTNNEEIMDLRFRMIKNACAVLM